MGVIMHRKYWHLNCDNMAKVEINKLSLKNLLKNFENNISEKKARLARGLKNSNLVIVSKIQENLEKNGRTDTRELYNSITSTAVSVTPKILKSSVFSASDHAFATEFGRKAGKMPNINSLVGWAVRKRITTSLGATDTYEKIKRTGSKKQKKEMGIIFAIAKKIAKIGYKGKKSFSTVFEEVEDIVLKEMIKSFK